MKRACLWFAVTLVVVAGGWLLASGKRPAGVSLVQPAVAAIQEVGQRSTPNTGPALQPVPAGGTCPDQAAAVTTTVGPACDVLGLAFGLELCNTSTDPLVDVVVTDILPIGLMFQDGSLSAVDSGGNSFPVALCGPPVGQTIDICLLAPLPAGECVTIIFVAEFSDVLCNHVIITAGGSGGSGGNEGCTPGYWKNHFSEWEPTGYAPTDDFDTVFGVDGFDPDRSLEQAVNQGGGGVKALGRHAVAALLSAAHPEVDYGLDAVGVIAVVQSAFAPGGDVEDAKNQLEQLNEMGCPIGQEGGGGPGQDDPLATETVCLDELLGDMIGCICDTDGLVGACCLGDGSCVEGPADECSTAGGSYQGDGTSCTPNLCGGGGGEPCEECFDIWAFCELNPAEECDLYALETCIFDFEDNIFIYLDDAEMSFWDERCDACCPPDDVTCNCLGGGG